MDRIETYTKRSLLRCFLLGSKRFFAASILASFVMAAADMIVPRLIGVTVDTVLGAESDNASAAVVWLIGTLGGAENIRRHLWWMALIVVAVALVGAFARYLTQYDNIKASETMMVRMRRTLFGHLQRLPYSWHMKNRTGDIIQRCTSDIDTVRSFVSEQLTSVFRIVIIVGMSLFFMFRIHTGMALIALAAVPVVLAYSIIFRAGIGRGFKECDENEGVLSAIAQENLTGVRVVRAFGREAYESERFDRQNNKFTDLWVDLCRYLGLFWCCGDLLSALQVMLVIVIGAMTAVRGSLTVGEYIALISYNAMLTWPVRQLGRVISEMSKADVSLDRIRDIMNAEPEADSPEALCPDMTGDVVFSHVSYAYEGDKQVLSDVTFTARGGRVFGILGPTGSGKSTLTYLLDRLLELPPDGGSITIGGVDIRHIDRKWLRSHVSLVLQEPYLFSRTVGENIAITDPAADTDAIREVAADACLDSTVTGFTDGYDTVVGERGVTLSGGQKQRVAIARALLREAPILILDDSLSAVDARTDADIRARLRRRYKDTTVILISHRITTLMHADTVMVLDRGRVAEMGTHRELLAAGGIYRRIYDMQTGVAEEAASAAGAEPGADTPNGEVKA